MARIKEAPSGLYEAEAGQYWTPKPVFHTAVQLGENIRHGRNETHFVGAAPKSAWAGIS